MREIDRKRLYQALGADVLGRPPGTAQVAGVEALLASFARHGGGDGRHLAYGLATAWHETAGRLQPVRETLAASDAEAIARLDRAMAAGRLPQVSAPYWRPDDAGKSWFGRGFVQITHRRNYQRLSEALGVDLVADPARSLQPRIAADILTIGLRDGLFTGKRLADFFTADTSDWRNARRTVNGLDRADKIAAAAEALWKALA